MSAFSQAPSQGAPREAAPEALFRDPPGSAGPGFAGPGVQPADSVHAQAWSHHVDRMDPETRLEPPEPIDLGEQVVGSQHVFEIPAPRNTSHAVMAFAACSIDGPPELELRHAHSDLFPMTSGAPFQVAFAPSRAGAYDATLTYTVTWSDQHVEQRAVPLWARARALDAVPENAPRSTRRPKSAPEAKDDEKDDRVLTVRGEQHWNGVRDSHKALVREQWRGVDVVERESAKFRPLPAPRSVWGVLAELAITMGTAGIAAAVGKAVGEKLVGLFSHVREGAEHLGHDLAVDGLATGIEDGIKLGAEQAIGEHDGEKDDSEHDDHEGKKPEAASADRKIAFFSEQKSAIDAAGGKADHKLSAIVANLLIRHPEVADDVIGGIAMAFAEAKDSAFQQQATATTLQWLVYSARTKLGTQRVGDQTVTDMTAQRTHKNPLMPAELATGVLEIAAERDPTTHDVSVRGARVYNIASLVAQRLLSEQLHGAGIPIRIEVGGLATITVDEAGRIRMSGSPLVLDGPMTEAQQLREAERIATVVLGRSLKAWGITHVANNDASDERQPE